MNQFNEVIKNSKLFNHIPEEHLADILSSLHATFQQYKKDEYIQRLGEPFLYAGIVLEGIVEGSFISENYNKINMNHFTQGSFFGDALGCVETNYSPIQLKALTDCTILLLDLKQILKDDFIGCDYHLTLSKNLILILSNKNVFTNLKLRIASQKSMRDRILMYFTSLIPNEDGFIQIPFTKTALAEFLGVNRSALSRELGRMQDEKLILLNGKQVKLLQ